MGIFGKGISGKTQDGQGAPSRSGLGQSFIEKAKQAFSHKPVEGAKDPLDELFFYGCQQVVNQAKAFRNGFPGLEEIKREVIENEILNLIYTNRNSIFELHKNSPQQNRRSDEELEKALKNFEVFAGLERIAPIPRLEEYNEKLHEESNNENDKNIDPNYIVSVLQVGYRFKGASEPAKIYGKWPAKAKVVVNRRSS